MASNNHLTWTTFGAGGAAFTAGLWTEDDFSMPLGAAAELIDYYPLPQGGLRAWFERDTSAISTSGIGANEHVCGLFVRGDIPLRVGVGTAPDRYVQTFSTADSRHRVYRMDETAGATTWTEIFESDAASGTSTSFHGFRYYQEVDGTEYVIFTTGSAGTADAGIYAVEYELGTVSQLATYTGPFTTHQGRIVVADGSGVNPSLIHWTEPGDLNIGGNEFPADNSLEVQPNKGNNLIKAIEAYSPGDLMIGFVGAPWVNVQGDIETPTIYEMSGANAVGAAPTQMVDTPEGLAYLGRDKDLWQTDNGNTHVSLSPQLAAFEVLNQTARTPGKGDFYDQWLMMPQGLVMDWETKAWFQAGDVQNTGSWWAVDTETAKVMVATEGAGFAIYEYTLKQTTTRSSTASWKSGPLRSGDGRQIEIREVQVFIDSQAAASQLAVTVAGTTRTVTGLGAGRHIVRFLFALRDEMLDVKVAGTGGSSLEAPIIEAIKVGWQPGHLTVV